MDRIGRIGSGIRIRYGISDRALEYLVVQRVTIKYNHFIRQFLHYYFLFDNSNSNSTWLLPLSDTCIGTTRLLLHLSCRNHCMRR